MKNVTINQLQIFDDAHLIVEIFKLGDVEIDTIVLGRDYRELLNSTKFADISVRTKIALHIATKHFPAYHLQIAI